MGLFASCREGEEAEGAGGKQNQAGGLGSWGGRGLLSDGEGEIGTGGKFAPRGSIRGQVVGAWDKSDD